eukprot:scaffold84885_cov30-Tisochrysis_lutea.AAC.6
MDVAATDGVGSRERDDGTVVEAHPIERVAQGIGMVMTPRQEPIRWTLVGALRVASANLVRKLGSAHPLDGDVRCELPDIRVGQLRDRPLHPIHESARRTEAIVGPVVGLRFEAHRGARAPLVLRLDVRAGIVPRKPDERGRDSRAVDHLVDDVSSSLNSPCYDHGHAKRVGSVVQDCEKAWKKSDWLPAKATLQCAKTGSRTISMSAASIITVPSSLLNWRPSHVKLLGPWAVKTGGVHMAHANAVRARQSNDLAVVEAHAVKCSTQVFRTVMWAHEVPRRRAVFRALGVNTSSAKWDDGAAQRGDAHNTSQLIEICVAYGWHGELDRL